MIKFLEIMDETHGQLYIHQDFVDVIKPMVYEDERYLRIDARDCAYLTKENEKIRWVTLEEMKRRCNKFIEGDKDE